MHGQQNISHISVSYPRAFMPSVVQVGGLHITEPNKLPQVSRGKIKIMVNLHSRVRSATSGVS